MTPEKMTDFEMTHRIGTERNNQTYLKNMCLEISKPFKIGLTPQPES